jgi:hypothetical protein
MNTPEIHPSLPPNTVFQLTASRMTSFFFDVISAARSPQLNTKPFGGIRMPVLETATYTFIKTLEKRDDEYLRRYVCIAPSPAPY